MMTGKRMQDVHIRRMQIEDIPQVVAIDHASYTLPWTERAFRYEVSQNTAARPWVAEVAKEDGSLVLAGIMVIWLIVDEAHVATIAIHPDYRRQSIGRRLLAYGLLEAELEGARTSYLEVRRGNLAAREMYLRFGYEEVGIRPRYYKDTFEDAILMTLPRLNPLSLEMLAK
jgi:[ribosomal protein S18]-alanine N-acetyltransferase